jgi:copper resistance protein C
MSPKTSLACAGAFAAAVSAAAISPAPQALARFMGGAYLDHAVPGVGLTVSGPVRELRLYFTIGVLAASSSVQVTSSTGAVIAAIKPVNDSSDQSVVVVRLGRALPAGIYMVSWHVVSVNRRATSGTFHFTVS